VRRENAASPPAAPSQKVGLTIRLSTLVAAVLAVVASWLAWLGFSGAYTIKVSAGAVSLYLFGSALCFAGLAFVTIRQPHGWLRAVGLIALAAMLFTLAMAIVFYRALSGIVEPEF
jgi:hypothetical protein